MTEQTETGGQSINKTARNWAMACHMIALVGLLGNGIGFFLGPLILWLVKREDDPFIDEQGKEAVNFQLTMCIALFVCFLLMFVVIGFVLLPIVLLLDIIFVIIAGMKAANGEHYRYPFAIRFLK